MQRYGRFGVATLLAVLAVVATAPSDQASARGHAPPGPTSPSSAAQPTIEVRGIFEHVAAHGDHDGGAVYILSTDERAWRLEGIDDLPGRTPPSQSRVTVVGAPHGTDALTVSDLVVERSPRRAAFTAPTSTRTLGIRVYWGATPPAKPTTSTFRKKVVADSTAWFREVSGGRYTVTGAVTKWLRVPRPANCVGSFHSVGDQAIAAARRAGYPVGSFTRFIIYMPCSDGSVAGVATIHGSRVWLFKTLEKGVVMHEQGHNLGLEHASSRQCKGPKGWPVTTWSRRCDVAEYGDRIDAMGNRESGHFNSYFKKLLGWLGSSTTVSSSRTINLRPYTGPGVGVRAARVKSGPKTFWLEYRTRRGADAGMAKGTDGVEIRLQAPGRRTQLLDAAPGSSKGFFDSADVALPVGSSWTTPEKVRITVLRQGPKGAKVRVRYRTPPRRPDRPGFVRAVPMVRGVKLSWGRPGDNGSIIGRYEVKNLRTGAIRTVESVGGRTTRLKWTGLKPGTPYRFSVRAVNVLGRSDAGRSQAARPLTDAPTVVIDTPPAGSTVQGQVAVTYDVSPNSITGSRIASVELLVDGEYVDGDFQAPFGPLVWSSLGEPDGPHTLRVIVTDRRGKSSSATRRVVLANPVPVIISQPSANATLTNATEVDYTLAPPLRDWSGVELRVNGGWADFATPGGPLFFEPAQWGPGIHDLRVVGDHSPSGQSFRSAKVEVTVPTPTVAITAPTSGSAISTPVDVLYDLSPWEWDFVELYVDGSYHDFAWAGEPLRFDPASLASGDRTLVVRAYDTWGNTYDSAPRIVAV